MHIPVEEFVRGMAQISPKHFENQRVLEVGSRDINGSIRGLFLNCDYTGLDLTPGPGVDKVCHVVDLDEPDESYGTVVSTEALEHDRLWKHSLKKMQRLVKPGGVLILSFASNGRPEHGTSAHDPASSPATNDWYHNISPNEFCEAVDLDQFYYFILESEPGDVRFFGMKHLTQQEVVL